MKKLYYWLFLFITCFSPLFAKKVPQIVTVIYQGNDNTARLFQYSAEAALSKIDSIRQVYEESLKESPENMVRFWKLNGLTGLVKISVKGQKIVFLLEDFKGKKQSLGFPKKKDIRTIENMQKN